MRVSWLWVAMYGLTAYRLARLVVTDTITAPVREAVRARTFVDEVAKDGFGAVVDRRTRARAPWRWIHGLITCHWCASVWTAAAVVAIARYAPTAAHYLGFGGALATISGWLGEHV